MPHTAPVSLLAALTAAAAGLAGPGAARAVAHGPCGCLDRTLAEPGSEVRIAGPDRRWPGHPAYRVVLNPRPGDLGITPGHLASAHRADAPTTTVLSRPRRRPTRRARFRVPEGTPPGLYMVLIWDGEEGGAHTTWDYLHVADPDHPAHRGVVAVPSGPSDRTARARRPGAGLPTASSTDWPVLLGVALVCVAAGAAAGAGLAAGRRRAPRSGEVRPGAPTEPRGR
jgi:hypothetical protein